MKFDAYEYIGVIVPGSILIVTLAVLFPQMLPTLGSSLSLGDLGLVLILAFVAGHLLQAFGNFWETLIWWFAGGMPTTWVARSNTTLLTDAQLKRLDVKLKADVGVTRAALKDGRGTMREIFVHIRKDGKPDRVDKFNRNYGLMRGIAVGLLAAAAVTLFADLAYWKAGRRTLCTGRCRYVSHGALRHSLCT